MYSPLAIKLRQRAKKRLGNDEDDMKFKLLESSTQQSIDLRPH